MDSHEAGSLLRQLTLQNLARLQKDESDVAICQVESCKASFIPTDGETICPDCAARGFTQFKRHIH